MKSFTRRNFLRGLMPVLMLSLIYMGRPAFAQEKTIDTVTAAELEEMRKSESRLAGVWKGQGEFALVKIYEAIIVVNLTFMRTTPIGKAKFVPPSGRDGNPMLIIAGTFEANKFSGYAPIHLPPDRVQALCNLDYLPGPFDPDWWFPSLVELTISEDGNTLHGRYQDVSLEAPSVCRSRERKRFWVSFTLTRVCKCQPCQKCVNEQCVADFDENKKRCNQFPQDQVIALHNLVSMTISASCNEGVCKDGKCTLISDRWGITAILQAAEGAVDKILGPPFGSCLPEPLRQKVQQNLAGGLEIKCFDDPQGHCGPLGIELSSFACACTDPDDPDVIILNNSSLDTCAAQNAAFMGSTPPSLEKTFEKELFHEILHAKGGLMPRGHRGVPPEVDVSLACDKACYGFVSSVSPQDFAKIDPKLCR